METKHTHIETGKEILKSNNGLRGGNFRSLSQNKRLKRNGGFSLVELLVVISIIAIIASIALPAIGNTSEAARLAKSRRNAQNIASMFMAAETAGVNFFASGDLDQTIQNIVDGGTVLSGAFAGEFFGVPGMSADEQSNASSYLELNDSMLVYRADG